jgi:Ser/Thr protein kinase RdoA (MazF antagonist)
VSFIEHDPQVPALLAAWVVGYRKTAPLAPADIDEIPTFVVLRRILLCAWVASHAEVPIAIRLGAGYTEGTVAIAEELLRGRFLFTRKEPS